MFNPLVKMWDLLTPEQQSEVEKEVAAASSEPLQLPAMSESSTYAAHNLPGTDAESGCKCATCARVRAAE